MYNNVELPEIPNWDRTTYPYAVLSTNNWFSRLYCYLYLLKDYQYRDKDANNRYLDFTTDLYYFVSYPPAEPATEWGSINMEEKTESIHIGSIKWANFDILNADGSVKLAASDPVPVGGEPEQPETPGALPVTPYLPKNGAWVKHDIYKQVGNSWVKQPQGAVEVEDGAWQGLL